MRQELFNCALVITSALLLAGCEEHTDTAPAQSNVKYYRRTSGTAIYSICIEGHEYIILNGSHKSNIIHSESCPCKKEAKK